MRINVQSYIIYTACLLRVSATLVVILRGVHYKRYNTKRFEPMHKYKILSFKMCASKYIIKYKIEILSVFYIQDVTGGTDQTSGECSLGQTIPI